MRQREEEEEESCSVCVRACVCVWFYVLYKFVLPLKTHLSSLGNCKYSLIILSVKITFFGSVFCFLFVCFSGQKTKMHF